MAAQALVWYGDGLQALCYGERNVIKGKSGELVRPLFIVPSIELMKIYNIKEEELPFETEDGRRGIWMEYGVNKIDWIRRTYNGGVIFIWCAFNGAPTEIMRKPELNFEKMSMAEKMEDVHLRNNAYLLGLLKDVVANQGNLFKNMKDLSDAAFGEPIDESDENQEG